MKRFSYGLVSFFLFFVAESVSSADTIDYVYTENGLFGTMDLQNGSFTTIGSLSTTYDDMTRFPKPASLTLLGSALLGLGVVYLRRRGGKTMVRPLFATALLASAVSARADVFKMGGSQNANGTWTGLASLSFVTVGDPGNAADTTGYGSVPYVYQMGRYDVTLGQYTAFLNSVATKSDPYGLYYSGMAPGNDMPTIGIVQSGAPGSYSYTVGGSYSQAANCPIYDVSWGDAARFVNWLDNGQPTSGTESTGTTETGAYALNGATSQRRLWRSLRLLTAAVTRPLISFLAKMSGIRQRITVGVGLIPHITPIRLRATLRRATRCRTWATTPTFTLATSPIRPTT